MKRAFILALAMASLVAVGAAGGEQKKKYPHLWIKYENHPTATGCFTTKSKRALFCQYDETVPIMRSTTLGVKELPPEKDRVYLPATGAKLKLSQKQ